MDLKYYVLWKANNTMLLEYEERYYQKLLWLLKILQEKGILQEEIEAFLSCKDKRNFLLHPDISSLIQILSTDADFVVDRKIYEEKLKSEIIPFSEGRIMHKWDLIVWTNIRITVLDNNPYNIFDEHPDHEETGWVLWWGKKSENEWLSIYEKTFSLLKKIDGWFYSELNHIIKKIVPLGTSKDTHNSSSYSQCIGTLYLWYTLNSTTPEIHNLEAIIHESSHNKLNLLFQFDPIILNTREEIYYSAIRPDARPISGVFIGYHAFAPTMYIVMKAYKEWYLWNDQKWFEKIVLYYIKTKFLQKTIKKYWIFTPLWEEICREIDFVILLMDKLFRELSPSKELILRAKSMQDKHFKEVNQKYSYLQY